MTKSIALMLALIATSASSVPTVGASTPAARALQVLADPAARRVLVIAHRACWHEAPENSVAAIRACAAMGVDGVEMDVRHTKDGVAVIMHDETIDRTTNGRGRIADLTWAEVSRLRLREGGGGPDAKVTSDKVPTLDQYLAAARNRLMIVFDVKDWSQGTTFAAISRAHMEKQAIFFYECNNDRLLNAIRPFRDRVTLFPIIFEADGPIEAGLKKCPSNPAGWAHVKYQSTDWLDHAKQIAARDGVRLWTATMFPEDAARLDDAAATRDPDAVWGRQIQSGARMIMTNTPRELLAFLHRQQSPANTKPGE